MSVRRFDSQFNPEDLARITHRGLKPTSKKSKPTITHQNLESLKTVARNQAKAEASASRYWHQFVAGLANFLASLCAKPDKEKVNHMCENYGHVLQPGWKGDFPVCLDCKHVITDISQVRSSNLKNQKKNDDPYDNTGRKYVT